MLIQRLHTCTPLGEEMWPHVLETADKVERLQFTFFNIFLHESFVHTPFPLFLRGGVDTVTPPNLRYLFARIVCAIYAHYVIICVESLQASILCLKRPRRKDKIKEVIICRCLSECQSKIAIKHTAIWLHEHCSKICWPTLDTTIMMKISSREKWFSVILIRIDCLLGCYDISHWLHYFHHCWESR